jgi:uncharacterized protein DUF4404
MPTERLTALLRELDQELAALGSLDADARLPAEAVLAQLRRLGLGGTQAPPSAHGLEGLAVRFEADHPAIAATLRQVADQLGKAGI